MCRHRPHPPATTSGRHSQFGFFGSHATCVRPEGGIDGMEDVLVRLHLRPSATHAMTSMWLRTCAAIWLCTEPHVFPEGWQVADSTFAKSRFITESASICAHRGPACCHSLRLTIYSMGKHDAVSQQTWFFSENVTQQSSTTTTLYLASVAPLDRSHPFPHLGQSRTNR